MSQVSPGTLCFTRAVKKMFIKVKLLILALAIDFTKVMKIFKWRFHDLSKGHNAQVWIEVAQPVCCGRSRVLSFKFIELGTLQKVPEIGSFIVRLHWALVWYIGFSVHCSLHCCYMYNPKVIIIIRYFKYIGSNQIHLLFSALSAHIIISFYKK